eukprot:1890997-Amphidinium_carterae.1
MACTRGARGEVPTRGSRRAGAMAEPIGQQGRASHRGARQLVQHRIMDASRVGGSMLHCICQQERPERKNAQAEPRQPREAKLLIAL